jgi:hypothetical protein
LHSVVELVLELVSPSFVLTLLLSKVCRFLKGYSPPSSHLGPYNVPVGGRTLAEPELAQLHWDASYDPLDLTHGGDLLI